jgi:hypothetical protein
VALEVLHGVSTKLDTKREREIRHPLMILTKANKFVELHT